MDAALLSKSVKRYTRSESTSVPVERAEQINDSLTYTVGIYLKSLDDDRKALDMLPSRSMAMIYEAGRLDALPKLWYATGSSVICPTGCTGTVPATAICA